MYACTFAPDLWFESSFTDKAVEHCARCPIQAHCAEAGKDQEFGVWGGITEQDRAPRIQARLAAEREAELQARNTQVMQLRSEGYSRRVIAEMVGIGEATVSRIFRVAA